MVIRLVHGALNGTHAVAKAYLRCITPARAQVDAIAVYACGQALVCAPSPRKRAAVPLVGPVGRGLGRAVPWNTLVPHGAAVR